MMLMFFFVLKLLKDWFKSISDQKLSLCAVITTMLLNFELHNYVEMDVNLLKILSESTDEERQKCMIFLNQQPDKKSWLVSSITI